jgi:predicted nucleic acid-binding protein
VSERTGPILFDTDVLVWYLRGLEAAAECIEGIPFERRTISSICLMELVQGCRNKKELKQVSSFLDETFSRIIHCEKPVSEKAIALLKTHALSDGLRTVDALIAATAVVNRSSLVTGNRRHFAMIPSLNLIVFSPA